MEVKRLKLDETHDEVQVWERGNFIGAGACYKNTDTDYMAQRVISVAIGLPLERFK